MGRRKWTSEEKAAASLAGKERMAKKWAEGRNKIVMGSPFPESEVAAGIGTAEAPHGVVAVLEPEVKVDGVTPPDGTVVDSAALEAYMAQRLIIETAEEKLNEVSTPIRDVVRVGSRELVLRVRTDGQMVSLQGPCLCGAVKREWHQICLKEPSNVA